MYEEAVRVRDRLAGLVDRLTFNAHIIETGTTSYRLRTTRTARTTSTGRSTTPEAIKQGGATSAKRGGAKSS